MQEISILHEQLREALKRGALLDPKTISEEVRHITVRQLDIPARIISLIEVLGVNTIWDLVHLSEEDCVKYRFLRSSRIRLLEFIRVINLAIDVLNGKHLLLMQR